MKYLELITAAYRLRNSIDENQAPSAEQTVTGVNLLNTMLAEWLADGIDVQYVPTTVAGVEDTLTIPAYAISAVTAKLAMRIIAARPITPEVLAQANDGFDTVQRQSLKDKLTPNKMLHVPKGEAYRRFRDISTL